MKINADLWSTRYWNTTEGRAVYWIQRALKPRASALAIGAAQCFYSIALQKIGEVQARRALELAGIEFPAWLADVPPASELVKRQNVRKSQKGTKKEAA